MTALPTFLGQKLFVKVVDHENRGWRCTTVFKGKSAEDRADAQIYLVYLAFTDFFGLLKLQRPDYFFPFVKNHLNRTLFIAFEGIPDVDQSCQHQMIFIHLPAFANRDQHFSQNADLNQISFKGYKLSLVLFYRPRYLTHSESSDRNLFTKLGFPPQHQTFLVSFLNLILRGPGILLALVYRYRSALSSEWIGKIRQSKSIVIHQSFFFDTEQASDVESINEALVASLEHEIEGDVHSFMGSEVNYRNTVFSGHQYNSFVVADHCQRIDWVIKDHFKYDFPISTAMPKQILP